MASNSGAPLRSEFAGDADMADIVRLFVEEMPTRVEALARCWEEQHFSELQRLAHQLKGASGGYGFHDLGTSAGHLERTLETLATSQGKSTNQALRKAFEDLLTLCKRVTH